MKNLLNIPSKSDGGNYQAVIEIPAGTNRKTEINKVTGAFETSLRNGNPRIIDFWVILLIMVLFQAHQWLKAGEEMVTR